MSSVYCTISTDSHIYKTAALFSSLEKFDSDTDRICWCLDEVPLYKLPYGRLVVPSCFPKGNRISKLFKRHSSGTDKLRWSLKPILIRHLLETYDKVVYLDNDTYFFNSPSFLLDKLDRHDILLTAHHYPRDPSSKQNWLEANFKVGLYNAGFIAVNRQAKHIMDWWADCCIYRCEKSLMRGLFDDQKYLDLVPVMHPKTKVLEHLGCNVAGWNVDICKREPQEDDLVLINGKWPIVFVHFNGFSIRAIIQGEDPLLLPYYSEYVDALKRFEPELEEESLWNESTYWDQFKLRAWKILNKLQNK